MAKRKVLDYYGIIELDTTPFGTRFFNCVKKRVNSQKVSFLEYSKFIRSVSILTKGNAMERLAFIYSIFDIDGNGYIERDEMIRTFTQFFESMMLVNFDNVHINVLKQRISESQEKSIRTGIEEIVDDIFNKYQTKSGILYFEDWKKWFIEVPGMQDVLNYRVDSSDDIGPNN
eukprot:TRINITY_DN196_c0_g3_i4.p2 TRINITY_DN196_c0_g3~~TRINITY_DN196_c0_g3_i4.p2  ORF type:complete len:173 (-),score=49.45 TRINITY_DN196_c0_g3_i4:110-628(-)